MVFTLDAIAILSNREVTWSKAMKAIVKILPDYFSNIDSQMDRLSPVIKLMGPYVLDVLMDKMEGLEILFWNLEVVPKHLPSWFSDLKVKMDMPDQFQENIRQIRNLNSSSSAAKMERFLALKSKLSATTF